MAKSIRLHARIKKGLGVVRVLITHPMEIGRRKNKKTGEVFPAHYIRQVTCEHNGKQVMLANWGTAISTNPYFSFKVIGARKGNTITVSWVDNKGGSDSGQDVFK